MSCFSDGGDNPERVHRQPGHGRPAPLSLHHPPHSYRPRQQVLGTGSGHGKAFKDSRVKTNVRQNKTLIETISRLMLRSMCASLWHYQASHRCSDLNHFCEFFFLHACHEIANALPWLLN